jgi:hypothetical protein
MGLNAHFAWGLAMWGSGDVAREDSNTMLAPIGYYYAAFHSGYALVHSYPYVKFESLSKMGHSKLALMLPEIPKLRYRFNFLREVRETINYLSGDSQAQRLRIVRGHTLRFVLFEKPGYSYSKILEQARDTSKKFLSQILQCLQTVDPNVIDRVPERGESMWVEEYLGEDVLLGIIPRNNTGPRILRKAFDLIDELG